MAHPAPNSVYPFRDRSRRIAMESVVQTTAALPRERAAALPWYLTALLAGATSIAVGLLWDISWHMTIGRDTFWTPAHMLVYLGGVLAGLSRGWVGGAGPLPRPRAGGGGGGGVLGGAR